MRRREVKPDWLAPVAETSVPKRVFLGWMGVRLHDRHQAHALHTILNGDSLHAKGLSAEHGVPDDPALSGLPGSFRELSDRGTDVPSEDLTGRWQNGDGVKTPGQSVFVSPYPSPP